MAINAVYNMPENARIQEFERARSRELDTLDVSARILPFAEEDADNILHEIQDDVTGLMLFRHAEEPFPLRQDTGVTRFYTPSGRYGERINMSEVVIERMRKPGSFGDPIDITAWTGEKMLDIAIREQNLMRYIRWNLLAKGIISVPDKSGVPVVVAQYSPNSTNAAVNWTTPATSAPLQDFRSLRDNNAGYGFDFGNKAEAYANSITWNYFNTNTNANDIAGKRGPGLASVLNIGDYNKWIAPGENLPSFIAMDDGYLDDTKTFQRFIPNGYIVTVGYHWAYGLEAGQYVSTRNGANQGLTGIYAEVGVTPEPPKLPWVARGHNGGVRVRYTRQIQILRVS